MGQLRESFQAVLKATRPHISEDASCAIIPVNGTPQENYLKLSTLTQLPPRGTRVTAGLPQPLIQGLL